MSGTPVMPAAVPTARFDPQLARRKLSGTLFLGACMFSIGILLLTLLVLLVDVFTKGLPYLDTDFLTGRHRGSLRAPGSCRRWSARSRSASSSAD